MHADVLIVGGGPVGLFLAGLLVDRGVDVAVLERREQPAEQSRAIGLHPPALDALAALGLDGTAVAEGTVVRRGLGFGDGRRLGEITFERAHPRYPFVLTLPQSRTEQLLAEHLELVAPGALRRGVEVVGMEHPGPDDGRPVRVTVRSAGAGEDTGETRAWTARVVVAADGAHSTVRRLAGIGVDRREWGDSYLMGDFAGGDSACARTAVIHLHRDGAVESFPLPGGRRRWVVHTGRRRRPENAEELLAVLCERWPPGGRGQGRGPDGAQDEAPDVPVPLEVPALPDPTTATMVSAFTVYRQLARRMVSGRTVVIGDAAHAISPIGGQGMTVGWLDALALAPLLSGLFDETRGEAPGTAPGEAPSSGSWPPSGPLGDRPEFLSFERDRLRAARRAARLAEANMMLGRPLWAAVRRGRDTLARVALAAGAQHRLARLYSMGGASTRGVPTGRADGH
ncbi:NAD(P)/FAD-dependent oxidoreductase [Citricoccus sp. NPDC055426]|uniref:FAD-dependent oxidoreductase n=1 Tax=Citricoccus sp. NPDC055426 TaxID=3155536 RepID=UPI00342E02BF